MKCYETMFIIKPTLSQEEIQQKIAFYKEVITSNGGEIKTCLDMGMRNLAYEIKKQKRGYYFVIYFMAEAVAIHELERRYRLSEDVLRFIIIKFTSKKEKEMWQTLIDRANNKPESNAQGANEASADSIKAHTQEASTNTQEQISPNAAQAARQQEINRDTSQKITSEASDGKTSQEVAKEEASQTITEAKNQQELAHRESNTNASTQAP